MIRSVEWEDANDQVQHLSSTNFGGIKVEKMSSEGFVGGNVNH